MRTLVSVMVVTLAAGAALAGSLVLVPGSNTALYRPTPRISADPASWYSPALYKKRGEPKPGDWLAEHPEPIQTFEVFAASQPVRPTQDRHTIYLSVVGPMKDADVKRLDILREFMEIYYTMPVKMGPPADLKDVTGRDRTMGPLKFRQYLTRDILGTTLPPLLPQDSVCLLGVTMEDLYPDPTWNYVFGEAMLDRRVGVYSLVRFYPAFWGEKDTPASDQLALVRSLKVLVHETGHMFGVHHCQTYECVMNGSNNLPESDRAPLWLCPECLKKFRWNIGFDVVERYKALQKFYKAHDMADEAEWVEKRLKECGAKTP
jgi:archaemetzincin